MTPLDARTLDAMRVLTARYNAGDPDEARDVLRAFLAAHDAATAAARDEELALKLRTLYLSNDPDSVPLARNAGRDAWIEVARAARAHIAKEQSQ